MLFSDNENTRRIGASLLCATDDLSALPAILDYLSRVGENERSDLASALWKFSDQRAVFKVALNHQSPAVRAAAVRVVSFSDSMGVIDLLERAAIDPDTEVREGVMKRVEGERGRHSDSPRIVTLLEAGVKDSDPQVRVASAEAWFAAFWPSCSLQLLPLLKDRNSKVRAKAATLLGACGDPGTTKALVAVARDRNSVVRGEVLKALVKLAKNGGVDANVFVRALDDKSWVARCEAIDGLAELSDRSALPKLCDKLHDPNEWVRRRAVFALGHIGDNAAIPYLSNSLAKADELTRRDIIGALAKFGTDEAFAVLLEVARRDPSEYGLVNALMYTHNRRALPILEIILEHAGHWRDQIEHTLHDLRRADNRRG